MKNICGETEFEQTHQQKCTGGQRAECHVVFTVVMAPSRAPLVSEDSGSAGFDRAEYCVDCADFLKDSWMLLALTGLSTGLRDCEYDEQRMTNTARSGHNVRSHVPQQLRSDSSQQGAALDRKQPNSCRGSLHHCLAVVVNKGCNTWDVKYFRAESLVHNTHAHQDNSAEQRENEQGDDEHIIREEVPEEPHITNLKVREGTNRESDRVSGQV